MTWLLERSTGEVLASRKASGHIFSIEAVEHIEAIEAKLKPSIRGSSAIIPIEGVLTRKRDYFAAWFGGGNTLYTDITNAVVQADADPLVDNIIFDVGTSPGGNIDGLFSTMKAIKSAKKPTKAIVRGMAASATYALVSQADEVIAENRVTLLGSVGVMKTFHVDENIVDVSSTKAPEKRPDVTTKEGLAAARKPLDAIHDELVSVIAKGRDTTTSKVNENFGRGAIVIAADAIKYGMIDKIGISKTATKSTAQSGGKVRGMNLQEFKASHPAAYAAAVNDGVEQERDRVSAHAILGEASGDMETALKAIKDGSQMTAAIDATYKAAAMKRDQIAARQSEEVPPVASATPKDGPDLQDQMLALMNAEGADSINLDNEEV